MSRVGADSKASTSEATVGGLRGLIPKVMELGGWRIGTMLLTFGANIWTARQLGPEKLGISGLVLISVGQATLVLGVPSATYLVRTYRECGTEKERAELVALATGIRLILLACGVVALGAIISLWHPAAIWRLPLAAGTALAAITVLQANWALQAQERTNTLMRIFFLAAVVFGVGAVGVLRPGSPAGLDVVVSAISGLVGTFLIWRFAQISVLGMRWNRATFERAFGHLKKCVWIYSTDVLVYLYLNLEVTLIGALLTTRDVGIYRVAHSLATSVSTLFNVLPLILLPRFIEWKKQSPALLHARQTQITTVIAIGGVVVVAAAWFFVPTLFGFIYGARYAGAARPFAILLAAKFVGLINNVMAMGLWAYRRDLAVLLATAVVAGCSVSLNVFLLPRFGIEAAACVNLTSETLILGAFYALGRRHRASEAYEV